MAIVVALIKFYAVDQQRDKLKKKGNAITKMLMTSLACSDALIAVLVMPFNVYELVNNGAWTLSKFMCTARSEVSNLLSIASVYHVACMALDRFLAVVKPLEYRTYKKRFGILLLCISWVLPIVVAILPTIHNWHQQGVEDVVLLYEQCMACVRIFNRTFLITTISISLYAPLVVTYILYALIMIQIMKSINKRRQLLSGYTLEVQRKSKENKEVTLVELNLALSNSFNCSIDPIFTLSSTDITPASQDSGISERNPSIPSSPSSSKAYRTIGCILLCLSACYLPVTIVTSVYSYYTMNMSTMLVIVMGWLPLLSSTFNPIIYCSSLTVRRALSSLFRPAK